MHDAAHRSPQHPTAEDPDRQGAPAFEPAPPVPRGSRGPLWLGIIAIVAGVVGLIIALMPAPYAFRIVLMIVGIVIALGGIAAAIIALRKKAPKGVAITGLIVSGVVALLTSAILVLGLIAEYQLEAMAQRNAEERDARLAEELAAQTAIFEKSAWLEDARAEAVESDFAAVDAAQLEEILADPATYEDQGIIVDATHFLPLTGDAMQSEGLCLTEVTLTPTDGSTLAYLARAAIVDRGTPEHCEFTDGPLGAETDAGDRSSFMDDFSELTRVWLAPTGTIPTEGGEDLPVLTLMRIVE